MLGWLLLAIALAWESQAAPQSAKHVVHESRAVNSRGWIKGTRLEARSILPVRIGLVQSSVDKIDDLLMELAHPDSPKYGQWMTPEEVHDIFAPTAEAVNAVKEWLQSAGIADDRIVHSDNKGWIALDATVEEAEMLLATTFHEYKHPSDENRLLVGADSYAIPQHLLSYIDYVTPGVKLVSVKKRHASLEKYDAKQAARPEDRSTSPYPDDMPNRERSSDTASRENILDYPLSLCWRDFTAKCARAIYKLPENPQADDCNNIGVFEEDYYYDQPDLDMSYWNYAPWVPNGTHPIPALINGALPNKTVNASIGYLQEAVLDITVVTSLLYPQDVVLYQVDDPIYSDRYGSDSRYFALNGFLDALDGSYCNFSAYGETGNSFPDPVYPNPDPAGYQGKPMCGVFKPTKVISMSVSANEALLPPNYLRRQCLEFGKLGMMGTSVIIASGDDGLGKPRFVNKDNFNQCNGPDDTIFDPQTPSGCPYVTSVGATRLYQNQTIDTPESVLSFIFNHNRYNLTSGSGFSNIFPRPDYQKDAVESYFQKYDPGYPYYSEFEPDFSKVQGIYNRIGRAYPDVSAYGFQWAMYQGGQPAGGVSGTSVSAPMFAAIITLLNQERTRIGKGSMGFLNPVLYAHPEVFNDIVNGTSLGCGSNGFPAVPGWDPSSGLGTPIYAKMKELWLSI